MQNMTLAEWMIRNDVHDGIVADAVEVSRPYINRIRNGLVHPNLGTALKIREYTNRGIDIRELLPKGQRPSTIERQKEAEALRGKSRKPAAPKASKQRATA